MLDTLHERIEHLRQQMYFAVAGKSLSDPAVVEISQHLDLLLNQLSRLTEQEQIENVA